MEANLIETNKELLINFIFIAIGGVGILLNCKGIAYAEKFKEYLEELSNHFDEKNLSIFLQNDLDEKQRAYFIYLLSPKLYFINVARRVSKLFCIFSLRTILIFIIPLFLGFTPYLDKEILTSSTIALYITFVFFCFCFLVISFFYKKTQQLLYIRNNFIFEANPIINNSNITI
jgi:hypothetical protein